MKHLYSKIVDTKSKKTSVQSNLLHSIYSTWASCKYFLKQELKTNLLKGDDVSLLAHFVDMLILLRLIIVNKVFWLSRYFNKFKFISWNIPKCIKECDDMYNVWTTFRNEIEKKSFSSSKMTHYVYLFNLGYIIILVIHILNLKQKWYHL